MFKAFFRCVTFVVAGTLGVLAAGPSRATPSLSVSPFVQTVVSGQPAHFNLLLSGLSPAVLGGFDLDYGYSTALLNLTGVTFGSGLGDPALFEALTSTDTSIPGIVDLAEVSLLTNAQLAALQPTAGFLLATLSFNAIGNGTATISFVSGTLADADGRALSFTVPEPSTLVLLALGLAASVKLRPKKVLSS
jgi:hypothetical protein